MCLHHQLRFQLKTPKSLAPTTGFSPKIQNKKVLDTKRDKKRRLDREKTVSAIEKRLSCVCVCVFPFVCHRQQQQQQQHKKMTE
jgi:hypothetical protein